MPAGDQVVYFGRLHGLSREEATSRAQLSAPLAMPVRWASGDVPVYQPVLAMLLTAATSVAFVAMASSIYRRVLVITGRRVGLREVLRGRPARGSAG